MTADFCTPSRSKPHFSSTRMEAGLFSYTVANNRCSAKAGIAAGANVPITAVMMPRPQWRRPSQ